MYEAVCPNGHRLQVPIEHAGMKLRCPACNAIFQLQLPNGSSPAAAAPAPSTIGVAPLSAPSSSAANPGSPTNAPAGTDAGGRWSGTDPSGQPTAPAAAASTPTTPAPTPASASAIPRPSISIVPRWSKSLTNSTHLVSQALLLIGLLLALSARGCEGVAAKNVVRMQGQADLDQRLFDEERETSILETQQRLDDPKISNTLRAQLQKDLEEKQSDFDKRRKELQNGEWRATANAAARAAAENRAASYWRELLFVGGTLLLAFGLGATALTSQGSERWVCFGLLAIIVFSLYVGGLAWAPALMQNIR